jgi:hypothetical protein
MSNNFHVNPKEERLNQLREEALNQMKKELFLMEFDEIKRAVKYFKIIRKKRIGGTSNYYDLAINALERQIPQEGVGEEGYFNCPKCGTGLIGEYCYECGQRTLKP